MKISELPAVGMMFYGSWRSVKEILLKREMFFTCCFFPIAVSSSRLIWTTAIVRATW